MSDTPPCVGRNVAAVRFADAGILVLVAGDVAQSQKIQDGALEWNRLSIFWKGVLRGISNRRVRTLRWTFRFTPLEYPVDVLTEVIAAIPTLGLVHLEKVRNRFFVDFPPRLPLPAEFDGDDHGG